MADDKKRKKKKLRISLPVKSCVAGSAVAGSSPQAAGRSLEHTDLTNSGTSLFMCDCPGDCPIFKVLYFITFEEIKNSNLEQLSQVLNKKDSELIIKYLS